MLKPSDYEKKLQEYFNNNQYDDALKYLEGFNSNGNLDTDFKKEVISQIGKIHFYSNRIKEARKSCMNILDIDPIDFYARIFLARILEKEGKPKSAMKLLKNVYNTNKNRDHLIYFIKELISELKHDDKEIEELILQNNEHIKETENSPLVSVIILCYNKIEFTEKCLESLFKNTNNDNYEVVVVDNASIDDTSGLLESYGDRIIFLKSMTNLGFVGGNNYAANFAKGEYLVFLNNDTEVEENWLENLLLVFRYYPKAGAAGAMLVYPDGKLQEAGGVIFNDASGWNYGKNDNQLDSRYRYVREVDYCSGAALMVKKNLFDSLGGFDERYAPAYYEDTDLCFGIRKLGYKVYYTPFSKVTHFEGATSGTDLNSGFKKFQVINGPKFIDKWENELKLQCPNNADLMYHFTDRNKGKRVLIIDDIPPLPDRAAGALRHYHTLNQMLELGYKVTYVHLMGKQFSDSNAKKYLTYFRMKGVEFIWFNYESWWNMRNSSNLPEITNSLIESLDLGKRGFDLVYIAFWHIAEYFVDIIRREIPEVPILVDTMDIHYLRELRQAEMSGKTELKKSAELNKKKEIALYKKVDCITTVTENDRLELKKYLPEKSVLILTDVHDPKETKTKFEDRNGFVFVGNFNHNPNEDAVLYFVDEIFPLIKTKLPDAKFLVVGNNPTEKIKALDSENIIVTGWVPEVEPYLEKSRVSVVPLRYGAGNKGKVGETLSYGLPMVSTTIGAEGMNIIDGEHSFVTDDPKEFAERAIKLYNDKSLWETFSISGKELIASIYSSELMRKRLDYILSFNSRAKFNSKFAMEFPNPPKVSIIIITYNQYEYSAKCISSLFKYTHESFEVIVVDNASKDDSANKINKDFNGIHVISNKENRGFPKAVNQGIAEAKGDYILILNNDTVVTAGWLERMIEAAESDPKIGIVGPISNEVSGLQKDNDAKYETIEEMSQYAGKVKEKNAGELFNFPRVAFLCTLIKREVINEIGGLDERFSPGNYEDDDFCLRTQMAGYKTVIAKDVFIHHFGSKSFKANGIEAYKERLNINREIFIDKWGATPDEIWIQNKEVKPHQRYYPVNKNLFIQYFERAKIHLSDNEPLFAEEAIKSAIENYTNEVEEIALAELYNLAGNLAFANNNLESAKEYFEKELNEDPNSSSACFGLGQVFIASDELEGAKVMLEWAVKNDESNLQAAELLEKVNAALV
ncbi:MAG: glycosyltransferase [Melioribacteraceae bacterium]|nr:glycosyltransferase [Melioribacteraceae bacterium]